MKALTIQQPYAWAVANGHKTVENRTGPAWKYRGPIAIHAGARLSSRGMTDPLVVAAMVRQYAWPEPDWTPRPGFTVDTVLGWAAREHLGLDSTLDQGDRVPVVPAMAVVGFAQLADAHPAHPGCCDDPWALVEYGGKQVSTHYVITAAFPLAVPVPVPGRLGLWELPQQVALDVAGRAGEVLGGAQVIPRALAAGAS